MSRGKFIAIEAMDAAGKKTQSELLATKLGALLISFPRYETEIGKAILGNLKGEWGATDTNWSDGEGGISFDNSNNPLVRQALFTLDRYDAAPEIKRVLASGRSVVVDRYWLSGLMYGASDLVNSGLLERVHECLPQPDVWVLLDVPVEESFRRRPERQDVYERDREKLEKIRKRYLEYFSQHGHETQAPWPGSSYVWHVVDGVGTIEQVHERVMKAIE
jgi:dTMP kinase